MNLNTLPVFNKEYLNKIYWDDRYKNEETFEWFHGYKNDTFRTVISETIKPTDKILMMGKWILRPVVTQPLKAQTNTALC